LTGAEGVPIMPSSPQFLMATNDPRIQGWVEGVLDRTRDRLRSDLTQLVVDLTDQMAEKQAEAARAARREAEAAAAALASEAMAAERLAAQERLAAAREESRRADAEREANLAEASALVDGFRALDAATTLSGVLDELVRRSALHTPRVALLLRQGEQLSGWSWTGFSGAGAARAFTSPIGDAGIAGVAARTGERQTAAGRQGGGPLSTSRDDRAGLALPLRVGGDVVGVLYADNDGEGPDVVPSAWPELIEALARHAERCLESVTVRGLPELVRAGAAERAQRQTERQDDEAAQRYARLLVAEIRLYHEPLMNEARRERSVLRKLRPQIERAQQLYEERVSADIRSRTRYFEQELVRTLADGDPELLGQAT
jgi:hypothetical protein